MMNKYAFLSGKTARRTVGSCRQWRLLCGIFAFLLALGPAAEARNEVQTITLTNVTAASVAITSPDYTGSATFAPGATAAQVQAALEAKFGTGTVSVTGSSSVGQNIAQLAASITGTASAPANLNNGTTGDTCVFNTSTQALTAIIDLGLNAAGQNKTASISTFKAFLQSQAPSGGPYAPVIGQFRLQGSNLKSGHI